MSEEGWVRTQRKVFTRWVNAYLRQRSLEIDDLDKDFEDGVLLIHLLEILGKEAIPKWNRTPKMKIHKQENLKKAWDFMKARGVQLMNIGAEDVTNGNAKIILADRRAARARRDRAAPAALNSPLRARAHARMRGSHAGRRRRCDQRDRRCPTVRDRAVCRRPLQPMS